MSRDYGKLKEKFHMFIHLSQVSSDSLMIQMVKQSFWYIIKRTDRISTNTTTFIGFLTYQINDLQKVNLK